MTFGILWWIFNLLSTRWIHWALYHSPALTAALRDLAIQIPQLKKEIQEGLLKNLSLILMGRQLRHPGAPKSPLQSLPLSGLDCLNLTCISISWFVALYIFYNIHLCSVYSQWKWLLHVKLFHFSCFFGLFFSLPHKSSRCSRCHKHYASIKNSWKFWLWRWMKWITIHMLI